MKKITNKQVFTVVLLVGVLVCVAVYMGVFTSYNNKTAALKASNAELQTQVNDMEQYFNNMGTYRANAAKMEAEITERTKDYPGDAREEDIVMMAVNMNAASVINFEKINVDESEVIHSIPVETVTGAGIEGLEEPIEFVEKKATYSNQTTYPNMKLAVQKVYESPYRVGINAISYRKESDSNNYISGTIDITYYSLRGMGKEYKAPEMPTYFGGGEGGDLFGILPYGAEEKNGDEGAAETDGQAEQQ